MNDVPCVSPKPQIVINVSNIAKYDFVFRARVRCVRVGNIKVYIIYNLTCAVNTTLFRILA